MFRLLRFGSSSGDGIIVGDGGGSGGGDGGSSGDSLDTWDLDMLDVGPHFTAELHS